jgi:polygalacturonase
MFATAALSLLYLAPALLASPVERCTGTISSLSDVAAAIQCTTVSFSCSHPVTLTPAHSEMKININAFTVPAGQTFEIAAPSGATINMLGDVKVSPHSDGTRAQFLRHSRSSDMPSGLDLYSR